MNKIKRNGNNHRIIALTEKTEIISKINKLFSFFSIFIILLFPRSLSVGLPCHSFPFLTSWSYPVSMMDNKYKRKEIKRKGEIKKDANGQVLVNTVKGERPFFSFPVSSFLPIPSLTISLSLPLASTVGLVSMTWKRKERAGEGNSTSFGK